MNAKVSVIANVQRLCCCCMYSGNGNLHLQLQQQLKCATVAVAVAVVDVAFLMKEFVFGLILFTRHKI